MRLFSGLSPRSFKYVGCATLHRVDVGRVSPRMFVCAHTILIGREHKRHGVESTHTAT